MDYVKIVKQIYKELGTEGLKALTKPKRTNYAIKFLKQYLNKKNKILDLACGYGRLTLIFAKKGYNIVGLDISKNLIKDAKLIAKKNNIKIKYTIGDMCRQPYKSNSFDKVFCMWSSFLNLITKRQQVNALKETYRILNKNGMAIFDLPILKRKELIKNKVKFIDKEKRIYTDTFSGVQNITYFHDKVTLAKICNAANIKNYKINVEHLGDRDRLILYIYK